MIGFQNLDAFAVAYHLHTFAVRHLPSQGGCVYREVCDSRNQKRNDRSTDHCMQFDADDVDRWVRMCSLYGDMGCPCPVWYTTPGTVRKSGSDYVK